MSANSTMGEETKFLQRWEFRRNDNDSSCNDSKSSGDHSGVKKLQQVSGVVTPDNDVSSDIVRCQEKGNNCDPSVSDEAKSGKVQTRRRGKQRSDKDNLAPNKRKRSLRKAVSRKKSKTGTTENDALNDLKNYMNTLLDDLKVTRKSLIVWMKEEMVKLVAEEGGSVSERIEGNSEGEKVQLQDQTKEKTQNQCRNIFGKNMQMQHQSNCQNNTEIQCQNIFGANVQIQYQNNSQENTGIHCQNIFGKNLQIQSTQETRETQCQNIFAKSVQMQHQNNFQDYDRLQHLKRIQKSVTMQQQHCGQNIEVQPHWNIQENTQLQHRNKPRSQTGAQDCNGGHSKRSCKRNKPDYDSANINLSLEYNSDYSQAIVSMPQIEKEPGKSTSMSVPQQKVQEQLPPKSIVLAISAQDRNCESSRRSARGKKTKDQDIITAPSSGNSKAGSSRRTSKGKKPTTTVSNNYHQSMEGQVNYSQDLVPMTPAVNPVSPMYLTSPTFLTNSQIQPRFTGNETNVNTERFTSLLGLGSYNAYFPGLDSRYKNYFNFNNSMASSLIAGSGFPAAFHHPATQLSLENMPREENNSAMGGLRMNGGGISCLGATQNPSGHYLANNFHALYKPDGNLMPFHDAYQYPK